MGDIQTVLDPFLGRPDEVVWFGMWRGRTPAKVFDTGQGFALVKIPESGRIAPFTRERPAELGDLRPPLPRKALAFLVEKGIVRTS